MSPNRHWQCNLGEAVQCPRVEFCYEVHGAMTIVNDEDDKAARDSLRLLDTVHHDIQHQSLSYVPMPVLVNFHSPHQTTLAAWEYLFDAVSQNLVDDAYLWTR